MRPKNTRLQQKTNDSERIEAGLPLRITLSSKHAISRLSLFSAEVSSSAPNDHNHCSWERGGRWHRNSCLSCRRAPGRRRFEGTDGDSGEGRTRAAKATRSFLVHVKPTGVDGASPLAPNSTVGPKLTRGIVACSSPGAGATRGLPPSKLQGVGGRVQDTEEDGVVEAVAEEAVAGKGQQWRRRRPFLSALRGEELLLLVGVLTNTSMVSSVGSANHAATAPWPSISLPLCVSSLTDTVGPASHQLRSCVGPRGVARTSRHRSSARRFAMARICFTRYNSASSSRTSSRASPSVIRRAISECSTSTGTPAKSSSSSTVRGRVT
eukprot:RCo051855